MIFGSITKLETFTDEFVCFVKVTTSDGHIGWGQTSNYHSDITAQVFHRQVAPWVLDKDASDIGALVTLVEAREHKFPGSYRARANAGLDTALGICVARLKANLLLNYWVAQPRSCAPMHHPCAAISHQRMKQSA